MASIIETLRIIGRGVSRRCPRCGARGIYRRWFVMYDRCPQCGLHFEREEGYWTGAMAINLITTELVFAAALLVAILKTWPDVPTIPLLVAGLVLNGVVSIAFYPIAKTIWIAIDLLLHPLEPVEVREIEYLRSVKERMTVD